MVGRPARRLWLVPVLAVVASALLLAAWHPGARGGLGEVIEGRLLDLRFAVRGPLPAPDTVAVVVFDDAALRALDAFPPPRASIARAVNGIFDAGARSVAIDMLLVNPRQDDGALVAALSRGPSVLAVAEAPSGSASPPLRDPAGFAVLGGFPASDPLPALAPAPGLQGQSALGHVTVQHDADGALRRIRPARAARGADGPLVLPALAVAAAAAGGPGPDLILTGNGGQLAGPWPDALLDLRGALALTYYGPAGAIPTLSTTALDGADLRGRVVFLGATATGFGDRHVTPFDAVLPGVEAHATLAANLMEGQVLRRDAVAWALGTALAMSAALAGLVAGGRHAPWTARLASAGVTALVLTVLQGAFGAGWWLDATTVLAALALGLGTGAAVRIRDQRRRAANLARYQSPRFVEALATQADPFRRNVPQPAVVVFVDVADFTGHAERIGPARTAAFLHDFHRRVEGAADPLGGTIMDFAGDGVLVVFGLPDTAADDARRALDFIAAVFASAARDGITLRAGAHAGPVTLSLLGGARHRTVAVSGDVVNTASRLQDFAKARGASLALSGALVDPDPAAQAWAATAGLTRLADQSLRGRTAREAIWVGTPLQVLASARAGHADDSPDPSTAAPAHADAASLQVRYGLNRWTGRDGSDA
ncbi:MAG: adenylate/guanylate cyclase domain-containing protein [Rhodobacteraceae bacterium]|jgi:adenylate cyclase|nr:adenylate/guanylate cyclase domain-containing protein [Paracoccaceae bacterium]